MIKDIIRHTGQHQTDRRVTTERSGKGWIENSTTFATQTESKTVCLVEKNTFSMSLWPAGVVLCPTTAAESLNSQQLYQSHPIWPSSKHNLLLGRLAEDRSSMEMRLGSQHFREVHHNPQIPPSRSPVEKLMDQWLCGISVPSTMS